MKLPNDYARCSGERGIDVCVNRDCCARHTDRGSESVVPYMDAAFDGTNCRYFIDDFSKLKDIFVAVK